MQMRPLFFACVQTMPWKFMVPNFALGTAAASPQQRKGYSQGPARRRRERPND